MGLVPPDQDSVKLYFDHDWEYRRSTPFSPPLHPPSAALILSKVPRIRPWDYDSLARNLSMKGSLLKLRRQLDKNRERAGHGCDSKSQPWPNSMGILKHKLSQWGERAGPSYCHSQSVAMSHLRVHVKALARLVICAMIQATPVAQRYLVKKSIGASRGAK